MEDRKNKRSTEETENNIEEKDSGLSKLDALLLDADDSEKYYEDEDIQFDEFMSEYRDLIAKNLSKAAEAKNAKPVVFDSEDEEEEEDESEFLISLPKKQQKKQIIKNTKKKLQDKDGWSKEITLEPEVYADLNDGDDDPLTEETVEEVVIPNFDLGDREEEKSDNFQISINFEGEQSNIDIEDEEEEEPMRKYDPEKPRAIDWVFDIAEMFAFVLAIVMILTTFVFKHSIVEGNSMKNTLEEGDHLIISDLFYTPKRGDIIVFEDYSTVLKKAVVKRVIAVSGDTVEVRMNEVGEVVVYVNNELVNEDYTLNTRDINIDVSNFNKPIIIEEGEVFVMGDNRYHSLDSRSSSVGPIKTDAILGKVLFRFLPFDKFGSVN